MSRNVFSCVLLGLIVFVSNNGPTRAAPAKVQNVNGDKIFSPQTRIIKGQAAREGQFPWQAAVRMDNAYFCGGSIIAPRWILTAAHCVYRIRFLTITVGSIYSGGLPQGAREPDRIVLLSLVGRPHPSYSEGMNTNDVGLILLPVALTFTPSVNAIALPPATPEFLSLNMKDVTVSGWGRTMDGGQVTPVLKYTNMTIIPGVICALVFHDFLMGSKICCGSIQGHSTCNGDSGGPLVYRAHDSKLYKVGIVAYGADTCTHNIPVVFTRVTSFLDFVSNTTGLQFGQSSSI